MSTYLHLVCLDHTPLLMAAAESGQHMYDLPQIRADIAERERIVANVQDGIWPGDHFRKNTAAFLVDHPRCRIGIADEYGEMHPTVTGDVTTTVPRDRVREGGSMSTSIEAVKAELESARHALRGAEEAYAADMRALRDAEDKANQSYEARAVNARNVERLEKALAILEEADRG